MTMTLEAPATTIEIAEPIVLEFPAYRLPELQNKIDIANRRLAKTEITERFGLTTEEVDRKTLKGGIELPDGTIFGATEVTEPYIRATLTDLRITSGHYTFVAALVSEEAGYTVHAAPGQNLDGWSVHLAPAEKTPLPSLPQVFRSVTDTEVGGLDADGPIAGMEDEEAIGDGAIENKIGESVGAFYPIGAGSDLPVSTAVGSGDPVPASGNGGNASHSEGEGFTKSETIGPSLEGQGTTVSGLSGVVLEAKTQTLNRGVAPGNRAVHEGMIPVCDHCNLKRDRRRLYIVRDERDGSLHQVGHSCIELYTGLKLKGLWALEFGKQLRGFGSDDAGGGPRSYSAPVDRVLGLAFAFAAEGRSYVSLKAAEFAPTPATAEDVRTALFGKIEQPKRKDYRLERDYQRALDSYHRFLENIQKGIAYGEDAALIAEIKAAADSLAPGTDYADNMHVILAGENVSYRNIGILVSLVAVYAREKELAVKREQKEPFAKGFLAPVKTRVRGLEITLTTVKSWEGQWGWTTLLVGRTADNHLVKWFASGEHDYEPGDTLSLKAATVKAHEVYEGIDQTVITRGILA